MGFLTDPRYAQTVNPGQVGQVARGMAAPIGPTNPAPLQPPHIADQAANIVGQYILDHGSMLRQRLQMAHAAGTLAPPKYGVPDLVSSLRTIPNMTADPNHSNQAALINRLQRGVRSNLPLLINQFHAQRYGGRH